MTSKSPDDAAPSRVSWRSLAQSAPQATTALALGIELRRRDTSRHHWSSPRATSASVRELARDPGDLMLAVRPLRRSDTTGAWIQSDANWDAVRRPSTQFDRAQSRWFGDLLSLARDSLLSGLAGDWLALDAVESRLLWTHLRDAAATGIPLVSTQRGVTISYVENVAVEVIAERDSSNELRLRASAHFDDAVAGGRYLRAIGRTGLYGYAVRGTTATVHLGEAPLNDSLRALVGHESVHVPGDEEPEFVHEVYPLFARQGALRQGEGVALPDLPAPQIAMTVRFIPGDRVEYSWEWKYEGYGSFPLAETADAIRDPLAEAQLRAQVEALWVNAAETDFVETTVLHDIDAAEFVAHTAPRLQDDGVQVTYLGERRAYHELSGQPEIRISTVESTDADWFDLGVIVEIEGRSIPFTPLFTALSLGRKKMKLADGAFFSLRHPALQRLRDLIDECTDLEEWEAGPRISRYQVALWEEFEDLADQTEQAVSWRATAEGLRGAEKVPVIGVPTGVEATLRPYQRTGLNWLAFLWHHRLGGILADDMGLGKTLQLLALIQHTREHGERRPFLVVAPTSVTDGWHQEAARYTPQLRVVVLTARPSSSSELRRLIDGADVLVTSYTVLRLGEEAIVDIDWAALVLDEAHVVKNAATMAHLAVAKVRADAVYAVTGTPLENSLTDLWALLRLVAPGLFPSAQRFRRDYVLPIEKGKVAENLEGGAHRLLQLQTLRRRIRPLVLRRTKEEVARDLPDKQQQVLRVALSPSHRALYDIVLQRERQKVLGLLSDLDRNRFIVFRSLTLLRMLSLSPGLIDEADVHIGSRKLDLLIERLQEMRGDGHRALVFSQFTSFLAEAARRLESAGIPYAYLDGATRQRPRVIADFREGEQPVFLISLKAGGVGLTLTEADYVFLLDPWWNPAAEAQAIDRAHRIGQSRTVMVYRLIAADTIEEKVLALQQRKARLFAAVMNDEDHFAQSLTAQDIRGLLEP